MAKRNVFEMRSRAVGDVHCKFCNRLIQNGGLPAEESEVDLYRLPQELVDEFNKMPVDKKFAMIGNRTVENWRALLDKYHVDYCQCGAIR